MLSDNDKKEVETVLEDMLCTTFYLENLGKSRFDDLKKRIENGDVLNNLE